MYSVQHAFYQNNSPQLVVGKALAFTLSVTAVVLGALAVLGAHHLLHVGALSHMPTSLQVLLITGGVCSGTTAVVFCGQKAEPHPLLVLVVQGAQDILIPAPPVISRPPLFQTHPHLVKREKLQAKDSFVGLPAPFLHALTPFLDPDSMANMAGVSREGNRVAEKMRMAVNENSSYWDTAFAQRGAKRLSESEGELPPHYRYKALPKPQSVLDID